MQISDGAPLFSVDVSMHPHIRVEIDILFQMSVILLGVHIFSFSPILGRQL